MVKVIGADLKLYKEASCKNCAARLQYTEHEVEKVSVRDYGGGTELYKFITCPQCSNKVTVK